MINRAVIGVVGPAGAGKSTVARLLREEGLQAVVLRTYKTMGFILYVTRPDAAPPGDDEAWSASDADYVLSNTGTLDDLKSSVRSLLSPDSVLSEQDTVP